MADNTQFQEALKRGSAHAWRGRWSEAAQEYRLAVSLSPEDQSALNYLAMALNKSGEFGEALEAYLRVWRGQPSNLSALQRVAELQESLGQRDAAIVSFRLLADAHTRSRSLDEALKFRQKVVELNPGDAASWDALVENASLVGSLGETVPRCLNLAREMFLRDRFQEAFQIVERVQAMDPSNVVVPRLMAAFRRTLEYSYRTAAAGVDIQREKIAHLVPTIEQLARSGDLPEIDEPLLPPIPTQSPPARNPQPPRQGDALPAPSELSGDGSRADGGAGIVGGAGGSTAASVAGPSTSSDLRQYLSRARKLALETRFKEAFEVAQRAQSLYPDSPELAEMIASLRRGLEYVYREVALGREILAEEVARLIADVEEDPPALQVEAAISPVEAAAPSEVAPLPVEDSRVDTDSSAATDEGTDIVAEVATEADLDDVPGAAPVEESSPGHPQGEAEAAGPVEAAAPPAEESVVEEAFSPGAGDADPAGSGSASLYPGPAREVLGEKSLEESPVLAEGEAEPVSAEVTVAEGAIFPGADEDEGEDDLAGSFGGTEYDAVAQVDVASDPEVVVSVQEGPAEELESVGLGEAGPVVETGIAEVQEPAPAWEEPVEETEAATPVVTPAESGPKRGGSWRAKLADAWRLMSMKEPEEDQPEEQSAIPTVPEVVVEEARSVPQEHAPAPSPVPAEKKPSERRQTLADLWRQMSMKEPEEEDVQASDQDPSMDWEPPASPEAAPIDGSITLEAQTMDGPPADGDGVVTSLETTARSDPGEPLEEAEPLLAEAASEDTVSEEPPALEVVEVEPEVAAILSPDRLLEVEVLLSRADSQVASGLIEEAISSYDDLLAIAPRMPAALLRSARLFLAREDLEEAEIRGRRALQSAIDGSSGDVVPGIDFFLELLRERSAAGDLARTGEGFIWLAEAVRHQKLSVESRELLASEPVELLGQGIGEHLEEIGALPACAREEVILALSRAERQLGEGHLRSAADEMYQLIVHYPDFLPAQSMLGRILVAQGREEEAKERSRRLQELYLMRGTPRRALEVLWWTVALGLGNGEERAKLVQLLREEHRPRDAEWVEMARWGSRAAGSRASVPAGGHSSQPASDGQPVGSPEEYRRNGRGEDGPSAAVHPWISEDGHRPGSNGTARAPGAESFPTGDEHVDGAEEQSLDWATDLALAEACRADGDREGAAELIRSALEAGDGDDGVRTALLRVLQTVDDSDGLRQEVADNLKRIGLSEDLADR